MDCLSDVSIERTRYTFVKVQRLMIEEQVLLKTTFENELARFLNETLSWGLRRAY